MRKPLPWILSAAYAAIFSLLGIVKYDAHRNFVDFGIFLQTAASAFGCFCNTVEGSHWAFHFSPILYVAGALLAVWHSPFALIVLGSVACALTIPPIYALVEQRSDGARARIAAAIVFVYPPLAGLAFGDFHENVFAPAAVAWMFWAFDAGYLRAAVGFAVLTLCVKEDQAVFLSVAAGCGAWRFRRTMPGLACIFALVLSLVALQVFRDIQPHAAVLATWQPVRFYAWNADDVRALFAHGIFERLGFLVLAFAPLGFVAFGSRMMWLAALPLGEVLASRMPTTFTIGSHYAGAWIGYVLVAFVFALRRRALRRWLVWSRVALACALIELAVANPLHPGLNLRVPQSRDRALDASVNAIPADMDVATQEEAYTHLALRDPRASLLPESASQTIDACEVLVDRAFPDSPRLIEYGDRLERLVADGTYRVVARNGPIVTYRRAGACR